MAFTLYSLLEATLLCLNAVCILHEERFLAKSMKSCSSSNSNLFSFRPGVKCLAVQAKYIFTLTQSEP